LQAEEIIVTLPYRTKSYVEQSDSRCSLRRVNIDLGYNTLPVVFSVTD